MFCIRSFHVLCWMVACIVLDRSMYFIGWFHVLQAVAVIADNF